MNSVVFDVRLMAHVFRSLLLFVCFGCVSLSANAFYDPFEKLDEITPSDELETRLWDEAKRLKPQLLRTENTKALKQATEFISGAFNQEFPGLDKVFKVYVYPESELAMITTPHGEIFMSSGLLLRIRDEQEFAAVLVREMAHVYQRDSARTLSYARLGANLKEVFSTAFAFYNLAAGISSLNSMANSLTGISPETLISQLQLTPDKLMQEGGKLLANSLKERLKDDLNDLGRNLGGVIVHRLSVQAVAALVKTSLYGYSDRIEREADLFALSYLQKRYGEVDAFERIMGRLSMQAKADGVIPYLSFYSNSDRMQARLDSVAEWKSQPSPILIPLAVKLAEFVNLPQGIVTVEQPRPSDPDQSTSPLVELVSADSPPTEEPVSADVSLSEEPVAADTSALEVVVAQSTPVPPALGSSTIFLKNEALDALMVESLSQESRHGAPARFLENLGGLIDQGVVQPKTAMVYQIQALKKNRNIDQKKKVLQLILDDIQSGEQHWKSHQMLADLYLDLKLYSEAIRHYDEAISQAMGDEYAPFLEDKRRKAETLLKKERAEK